MVKASLILFAIGATLGSLLDAIHTHSGTTIYASELFFKAAWWTPVLFGAAGVGVGLSYVVVERFVRVDATVTNASSASRLAIGFALFVAAYFASGFLPAANAVKLTLLLVCAAVIWFLSSRTAPALGVALVAAIVGPVVEITLIHNGAFRHLQPDVMGIPIWLPALYASGALAMGPIGKRMMWRVKRSISTLAGESFGDLNPRG